MLRYHAAAVCRRGHTISVTLPEPTPEVQVRISDRPSAWPEVAEHCPRCGAAVVVRCDSCRAFIKGIPQGSAGTGYRPPDFCEQCGAPFAWLSRQGRIYLLQNMLDAEELDPATRLEVQEQLEALARPDLDEEEQAARWQKVKQRAPALWEKTGAQKILETVVSAAIKGQLGLP